MHCGPRRRRVLDRHYVSPTVRPAAGIGSCLVSGARYLTIIMRSAECRAERQQLSQPPWQRPARIHVHSRNRRIASRGCQCMRRLAPGARGLHWHRAARAPPRRVCGEPKKRRRARRLIRRRRPRPANVLLGRLRQARRSPVAARAEDAGLLRGQQGGRLPLAEATPRRILGGLPRFLAHAHRCLLYAG